MTTSFRQDATDTEVKPVSAWRLPRFQRFATIMVGTGLLLSTVAISCLKTDVDIVTQEQIPFIQDQIANIHV